MIRRYSFFCVILNLVFINYANSCLEGPFAWRCTEDEECWKERYDSNNTQHISLEKCKLICGPHAALIPLPRQVKLGKETVPFLPSGLQVNHGNCPNPKICKLLDEASAIMKETISMYHPDYEQGTPLMTKVHNEAVKNHILDIRISVSSADDSLVLNIDESYGLRIITDNDTTSVYIDAATFFGARHALETFSQLVDFDEENNSLMAISDGYIWDKPEFTYRGLIVDTSRNFITVPQIKKIIRAMSYNKLNTFHWHIVDSHSFPLVLNSLPNMAKFGAYSSREVYFPSDVEDIVKYARVRGIRVLPEIDAPAHTGHGWEWAEETGLGKLVVCFNKKPWTSYCVEPPCGQMNIANPNLYEVLEKIYGDVASLFAPLDMFHYGGDEVNLNCWNTSTEITDWMVKNGFGLDDNAYFKQWSVFQEEARTRLTKANNATEVDGVIWTSKLTEKGRAAQYLDPTKYIIQVWTTGQDALIGELLEKKFRLIFSNYDAMYLDCGVSSWVAKGTNWCSPYKGWQDLYDNDLYRMATNLTKNPALNDQILGGEAAIWTEQADTQTMDAKLWPRGAALAERLWTNPKTDYSKAEYRILQHRNRLVKRGIAAARLQPEWCRQNQGQCRDPKLPKA